MFNRLFYLSHYEPEPEAAMKEGTLKGATQEKMRNDL